DIPRNLAQDYIDAYFARYPRIRGFLDQCIQDATLQGYATTLAGRRRYLPNMSSQNKNIRQANERIAMNTRIQGSAADLIKMAMLQVHERLQDGFKTRILLQVHDELVLEAPLAERDDVIALVRREMTDIQQLPEKLRVPLVVDIGHGHSWAEAH
ncbi:MAG: DNA polymerase, partial [Myxococcota bacterium]|nr:DNA polymerase [Myxococcota bacterium]